MVLSSQKKIVAKRRDFLKFLGGGIGLSFLGQTMPLKANSFVPGYLKSPMTIRSLPASIQDEVISHEGLNHRVMISWRDALNDQGDRFGFNNDYLHWTPLSSHEGILWVNHEYIHPLFIHGKDVSLDQKQKSHVDLERKEVGGSLVHFKRTKENPHWTLVFNSPFNRRLTADTPIPLINEQGEVERMTYGTLGNCAGGIVPWRKTLLTCEEGYDLFYGSKDKPDEKNAGGSLGWEKYYPHESEDYGWVVEVDPLTGSAKKYMSLGRFAHEACAVRVLEGGHVVAYTGDDRNGGFFYKFVSDTPYSFHSGTLFVADTKNGTWLPMVWEDSPLLKKHFKNQKEVLTYARYSAELLGATPLDRPEDVEIHPTTGDVYVTLTNNYDQGNLFGSIVRFREQSMSRTNLHFKMETFLLGGEETNMACPDNLCFDRQYNLWMTTDMSGSVMNRPPYTSFGNNGLYYIPLKDGPGYKAGLSYRLLSAPVDAECTGPFFTDDGTTLFLSIQHPGEKTKNLQELTSQWPKGSHPLNWPKPSVIQVYGPVLHQLQGVV